jgi:DNA repair photolyase
MVGLSTGIPVDRDDLARAIEPNASPILKRLNALKKAHEMGLRTYGMLCPCLPGVADSEAVLRELFDVVLARGAKGIWTEPINSRGRAVAHTVQALRRAGLNTEADAVDHIRNRSNWSSYAFEFVQNAVKVATEKKTLDQLHILLYSASLTDEHAAQLRKYPKGIVWLENEDEESAS